MQADQTGRLSSSHRPATGTAERPSPSTSSRRSGFEPRAWQRRQFPAARSMAPRIRQHHRIPMPQQHVCVTQHPNPIVRLPMQQDHCITISAHAIVCSRPQIPPSQRHSIVCSHLHICERRVIPRRNLLRALYIGLYRCAPHRMQRPISSHHPNDSRHHQPCRGNPQPPA